MDFDATVIPADVVVALSLAQGVLYSGQNVSGTSTLYVREQVAAPDLTDRAFRVESGGRFTLRPSGEPIWAWTDELAGCAVIVAVAP